MLITMFTTIIIAIVISFAILKFMVVTELFTEIMFTKFVREIES